MTASPSETYTTRAGKGSALSHTEMDDNWDRSSEASAYIGSIVMWPGIETDLPPGWLICDGQSLLRAGTFANLFGVIAVMYGNVDATHFNLPDIRGLFVRGTDTTTEGSAGIDPDVLDRTDRGDGTEDDAVGTKQAFASEIHTHTYVGHQGGFESVDTEFPDASAADVGSPTRTTNPAGASTETRPVNIGLHYIIRAA